MPEQESRLRSVGYQHIDGIMRDGKGALRLYRRRRWGWLPLRQDVRHPSGEWLSFIGGPGGGVDVTLSSAPVHREEEKG